jgi:flagellar basal body rod protein FlgG
MMLPIQPYISTQDGLSQSTKSMMAEMKAMEIHTKNIAHFGIPGYQGQKTVRRRFVEHLGPEVVESVVNTNVGRLRNTGVSTDMALSAEGYFQVLNQKTGITQLTRDGRSQIDKEGYLRGLEGGLFLDVNGQPIRFSQIPHNPDKEVKIDADGSIFHIDLNRRAITQKVAQLGIVSANQQPLKQAKVAQGFVEESNVMLAEEFTAMMPLRRQFEANRQFFLIQSDGLSRLIQELGRAQ